MFRGAGLFLVVLWGWGGCWGVGEVGATSQIGSEEDQITSEFNQQFKILWDSLDPVTQCGKQVIHGEVVGEELSREKTGKHGGAEESGRSLEEEEFEQRFLETDPWLPNWMEYSPEDNFAGFKIVPASESWCRPESGVLEVLGDIAGQNETLSTNSSSVETSSTFSLYTNGSLSLTNPEGIESRLDSDEFCVTPLSSGGFRFKRCVLLCPRKTLCFRKCCAKGEVLTNLGETKVECVPSNVPWIPTFYQNANEKVPEKSHPKNFVTLLGFPSCATEKYLVQSNVDKKYPNLLTNGTLLLLTSTKLTSKVTAIHPTEFCIDGFGEKVASGENETKKFAIYSQSEWHQVVVACSPPKPQVPTWIYRVYAFFNLVAASFLLITAAIYLILWSYQNIHGWLQFAHVVSLFFAYSILGVAQIWSQEIHEYSKTLCAYLGCLIQFTYLSAFFWLTSVNFDVWWRFSGRRSLRRITSKPYKERIKRFLLFASISLGLPALISGATMTLDIVYKDRQDEAPLKLPRFGHLNCFFEDKPSQFPYLYGPIGLLLFVNLLFFASTVIHLRKIHVNTEVARSHSTLEDKKGVRLIAKLVVVMGVLWIFELVSWTCSVAFPASQTLLIYVFLPTDILNSLQGVAIFVIFVCKPDIWTKLKAKANSIIPNKTSISVSTVYYGGNSTCPDLKGSSK